MNARKKTTVAGVACGVVCAVCVLCYLQSVQGEADAARAEALARYGGEQVEVCVASRDIAAGETVDVGALETRLWVADLLPADAVRSTSEVVGKQASSAILSGEVVSLRRFEEASALIDVPTGLTAVSVPAKDVQAVGGALASGMLVDVYATGDSGTTLIGEEVLVLATSASAKGTSDSSVSWITLAVEPASVQELVTMAQKAQLYFVLPGEDVGKVSAAESGKASRASGGDEAASASDGADSDAPGDSASSANGNADSNQKSAASDNSADAVGEGEGE